MEAIPSGGKNKAVARSLPNAFRAFNLKGGGGAIKGGAGSARLGPETGVAFTTTPRP